MREGKGKLIVVWVPGNHGAGGSTMSNGIGIVLQHLTGKCTLIANMGSSRNLMEQYMQRDMDIRFTMDYLRSFKTSLNAEHIKAYAAVVNEKLWVLPGFRLEGEAAEDKVEFSRSFIPSALEAYEIIIVDIEAGLNSHSSYLLDRADVILAVMNDNDIAFEQLISCKEPLKSYVYSEKTIVLYNAIHDKHNEVKLMKRFNKKYKIDSSFGIFYDGKAYAAACHEGQFYSFLKKELVKKRTDSTFTEQIIELGHAIRDRLFVEKEMQFNQKGLGMLFTKVKQWGEVDA